jgi:hypothetical protein
MPTGACGETPGLLPVTGRLHVADDGDNDATDAAGAEDRTKRGERLPKGQRSCGGIHRRKAPV